MLSFSQCPPPPSGVFDGSRHLYPVRVFFEDTDLGGVVYHANYLKYMERARSDMLRLVGIDQRETFEAGEGVYVIAEATIKYRAPAKFDDVLTIVSTVEDVRPVSATINQTVLRGETLIAEGRIAAVFVGPDGRPRRQPTSWVAMFNAIMTGADAQ